MIPTLGFGASFRGFDGNTSYCFALNSNIFSPEVIGVRGVVDIYQKNIMKLNFSGPTYFHYILNYVGNMVDKYVKYGVVNTYFVLMIITDGCIDDLNETIDEIVRCSHLPLSIIIVGVGNEDFDKMESLDADKHHLSSSKYGKMKNDIVQFVQMNKFINNPQLLTIETLKELPNQVSDYMKSINANPKNLINSPLSANFNVQEIMKAEFMQKNWSVQNLQRAISLGIPSFENEFINTYSHPKYINPFQK